MDEVNDTLDQADGPDTPSEPRPKALPIESRFLFVDVAAMRAGKISDIVPVTVEVRVHVIATRFIFAVADPANG